VTDALDRLAGPGGDLARRVDAALIAGGLPPDHAVVDLLRNLRALPGDVVDAICALRPAPLRAAADAARRHLDGYAESAADLTVAVAWAGPTSERYRARRRALVAHLGSAGDPGAESMTGRLAATASYLDDLADWAEEARAGLARALATALASTAAVELAAPSDVDRATTGHAADAGALILAAGARAYESGRVVAERWAGRLDEVVYREPADVGAPGGALRLGD